MDCKEVRNLLSEYLEDESFAQREFVSEHLRTCKNCAIEFEELKATVSAVAGLEKLKVPGDLLEGVHRKLRAEPKVSEIWKKLFYPIHIKLPLEAVAVAATVFLVLTIYNQGALKQSVLNQSALKPKPQELMLKSEVSKRIEVTHLPRVVPPAKETVITLVSHDIDRDLKLLPEIVNEVGGKIIGPPLEERMGLKDVSMPQTRSFDMTFQIPEDKMPIFMQKLETIGPPHAEYERELKFKEAAKEAPLSREPVIIRLKLNSPQ